MEYILVLLAVSFVAWLVLVAHYFLVVQPRTKKSYDQMIKSYNKMIDHLNAKEM